MASSDAFFELPNFALEGDFPEDVELIQTQQLFFSNALNIFDNSEKASELAILTVFDRMMQKEEKNLLTEKLNNSFFIVSLDYVLKLTMQITKV
jgi:hypothetical protein